jgi:hypothetical protein
MKSPKINFSLPAVTLLSVLFLTSPILQKPGSKGKRVLIGFGGWDGHERANTLHTPPLASLRRCNS